MSDVHFEPAEMSRSAHVQASTSILDAPLHRSPLPLCTEIDDGNLADLGDALVQAIELNRNRALSVNVRLHGYIVEGLMVPGCPLELLRELDAMLNTAIGMAVEGSLVMCEATITSGRAFVRISFAGKPARGSDSTPVHDCDIIRAWPRAPMLH